MWSSKKPEAPQAPKPEPRSLQTNQPLSPAPATLAGTPLSKGEATRPAQAITDSLVARLGPSLQVKGEISGSEDLCIDGQVEGSIRLEGRRLTIGSTAKVVADVAAGEVVVSGHLKGNVNAKKRVEIRKDGSVTGDLTTAQIMIEDGAYFKGSIEIERSVETIAGGKAFSRALN
jgi:cytoskeletal protein CcmA (bactofilin family)